MPTEAATADCILYVLLCMSHTVFFFELAVLASQWYGPAQIKAIALDLAGQMT